MSTVFLVLFGAACGGLGVTIGYMRGLSAGTRAMLSHLDRNHPAVAGLLIESIDARARGETITLARGSQEDFERLRERGKS